MIATEREQMGDQWAELSVCSARCVAFGLLLPHHISHRASRPTEIETLVPVKVPWANPMLYYCQYSDIYRERTIIIMLIMQFPVGARNFSSPPQRPDRLWGSPSLLSNGYQG
jgi:hypothetical protein